MTNQASMALFTTGIIILWLLLLTFIGPTVTRYSRKQWAIMMATLFALTMPMQYYVIFFVGFAKNVNPTHVASIAALNLGITIPLFILIGRRILKIGKWKRT